MALKYVKCEDCVCWRELLPSGHPPYKEGYGRCARMAPRPCNHGAHTAHDETPGIRNADWPHTYKHEGCYEGEKKTP